MAQVEMYLAVNDSKQTALVSDLSATATQMVVADASVLPAAPNVIALGDADGTEVTRYAGLSGNTLTGVLRGQGGTIPRMWPAGTRAARVYTALDHDAFVKNIRDLDARIRAPYAAALTLAAAAWANGVQTLDDPNITENSLGSLRVAQSATGAQALAFGLAQAQVISQAAGTVTVRANGTVPGVDIPVTLEVRA